MPSKESKTKATKSEKQAAKEAKKETKRRQKTTAKVSRERLNRISRSKKHHVRTTSRIFKYGTKSFVRNTWLSLAAIAIMCITLLILSATVIATDVMGTAIREFQAQVDVSVYIKQTTSRERVETVVERMRGLDSITSVTVTSPEEAKDKTIDMIAGDKGIVDPTIIEDLRNTDNVLPWTLNITLANIGDTSELENFVNTDSSMHNILDAKEPSYADDNREAIDNIASAMRKVELVGFTAAGVFAVVAILIVFNTIRMAIFNRKEEIYMMRLVGASTSFIIGPFLVEASLYGIIAALIASGATYGVTRALATSSQFGALVKPSFDMMCAEWYMGVAALLVVGVLIGVFSALCAARKYLKIK